MRDGNTKTVEVEVKKEHVKEEKKEELNDEEEEKKENVDDEESSSGDLTNEIRASSFAFNDDYLEPIVSDTDEEEYTVTVEGDR